MDGTYSSGTAELGAVTDLMGDSRAGRKPSTPEPASITIVTSAKGDAELPNGEVPKTGICVWACVVTHGRLSEVVNVSALGTSQASKAFTACLPCLWCLPSGMTRAFMQDLRDSNDPAHTPASGKTCLQCARSRSSRPCPSCTRQPTGCERTAPHRAITKAQTRAMKMVCGGRARGSPSFVFWMVVLRARMYILQHGVTGADGLAFTFHPSIAPIDT